MVPPIDRSSSTSRAESFGSRKPYWIRSLRVSFVSFLLRIARVLCRSLSVRAYLTRMPVHLQRQTVEATGTEHERSLVESPGEALSGGRSLTMSGLVPLRRLDISAGTVCPGKNDCVVGRAVAVVVVVAVRCWQGGQHCWCTDADKSCIPLAPSLPALLSLFAFTGYYKREPQERSWGFCF